MPRNVTAIMPDRAEPTLPAISDAERAALLLDELRNGFVLLDEAVTELADIDSWGGLALFLAARVELHPDTVRGAIEAPSDELVMALCRATGLSSNGFSAVLRMRRRRHRDAGNSLAEALARFHALPPEAAQRRLRDG